MKKTIFKLLGSLISALILCCFIYPEAGKHYEGFILGWGIASIHGATFLINYLISFFVEGRLIKAVSHSGAYNFWWWFAAIGSAISLIFQLLMVFLLLLKSKK
jgi:hypothetical protein